jgi:hypothetical protein|tara:strand:- start:48 stop:338 length:291 start_codon:yes stop_codon:yes gene_type:complete
MECKFPLGQPLASLSVLELCKYTAIDLGPFFERHRSGDWGDVSSELAQKNSLALDEGGAVLSVFQPHNRRIWIITNEERTQTVAMLPSDSAFPLLA